MAAAVEPPPALRRLVHCATGFVVLVALVVFVGGWVCGIVALRNIVPGTVGMKWQSAVGLLLAAAALLLSLDRTRLRRRAVGLALAGAVLLLGGAVLGEYVFGWRLGIDELLFRDRAGHALGVAYPGRFAPTTAICFVLLGVALLTLDLRASAGWGISELLVLPVGAIGAMTVVGYLYAIPSFYGPASAAKMALGTGCCFFALAAGVLLARPHGRLVTLAATDDPGGIMMRRLLPVAVVLPLLLGWAELHGQAGGLFGARVGTWWLSVATVVAFGLLITRVAAQLSAYARRGRVLEAELIRLANHDALTGLFNRHRFDQELQQVVARAVRYAEPCGLLIVDLDGMKAVNDSLGHGAGDDLLRSVAAVFRGRLRGVDVAARLGGDEFVVLLPATGAAGAAVVAEDLRAAIAQIVVRAGDAVATTKASFGVAALGPSVTDAARMLAHADAAMYRAKQAGGDRVHADRPAVTGLMLT